MENENTIQYIENQENQIQNNISNIGNFLQNIPNKDMIQNTLNSYNLTNDFESYLKDITKAKEIKLKNNLKKCNSEGEVYQIINDYIHEKTGYHIGYHDIENDDKILKINNQDNQQANINKQKNIESVSGFKELNDALSARQELIYDHPELAAQTDKNSELYQITKSELEKNGIIKQLRDSNHDANFIDNYILVHTTLKEVKSNENYKDINISFLEKAVKNLDNACNIPDTKLDNFSTDNITNTRSELFSEDIGNTNLIRAKESNKESPKHQDSYNKIFAIDGDQDTETQLIERYGKFVEDDDLKDLIKKYEKDGLNEQECDILTKGLGNIKENIDNQTKDLIEEMCLIAPISGILSCIGPNLKDNFELNKSNEIKNENGKVTIKGHVDGIKFSLRHDTTNPDARLQTSSILTKTDTNKFEIGERYEDSPFKLPTNGDIFAIAISCITDKGLGSTQNGKEYFQTLEKNICMKFETTLYKNTKDVNHYIGDKIKGEKISNQCLNLLGNIKGSHVNGDIEQSNSKLYNFIDLINSTNYISDISDKENISQCLETIQDIITTHGKNNTQISKYPKIIRHFLMKKKILRRTKKILNGYDIPGESIFDLFGYYTEQNSGIKTINFKQLKKDLEGKEGQESIIASNRQDNMERGNADVNLDTQLANIS